ncbi:MAG: hypothetical protein Q9168_004688 [Polycauliona sp. 1 TL-2023]
MSLLNTPTKADDEIGRIQLDLSAKWGLKFPEPGFRSPAKRKFDQPEEKALERLKYLYFHDRKSNQTATGHAISSFEQTARKLLAGWVKKPQGETDVLPSRTRSGARDDFLARSHVFNDDESSHLMQALLQSLTDVVESVRKEQTDTGNNDRTPQNKGSVPVRRSSRKSSEKSNSKATSLQRDGNIRSYMKQTIDNLQPLDPVATVQQPSSDDFIIDDGLFNDVEMQDAPSDAGPRIPPDSLRNGPGFGPMMVFSESNESLEDVYQTPPDSPSKMRLASGKYTDTKTRRQSSIQSPTRINPPYGPSESVLGQARKRAYPAPSKPDLPRKVSRDDSRNRQSLDALIHTAAYPRNLRRDHESFNGSLHRSFSSDTSTSVTTSGATIASSAWTTPNTSFLIETPGTSFDSINEPFELDYPGAKLTYTAQTLDEPCRPEKPVGLGLVIALDPIYPVKAVSMAPPALIPVNKASTEVSVEKVEAVACPHKNNAVGLRQLYELCRVSIQTQVPLEAFDHASTQVVDDYETLWSTIAVTAKQHGSTLPERSSSAAWKQSEQDFKGVALTGSLKFLEHPGHGVFEFRLNPLKVEPTYRLARKFGHDRFFVLSVPRIEPRHLPSHLNSDSNARQSIVDWLLQSEHSFLGRRWRAFYVKPEGRKAGPSSSVTLTDSKFRVYLFAENGHDFVSSANGGEKDPRMFEHSPTERKEVIEWLVSLKINRDQPALKFFSRIGLGVSQTRPALQFNPSQIIRSDDARADSPAERRLHHETSRQKKAHKKSIKSKSPVMNDGCARISRAAAKAIADILHLEYTPSIFQARIAGAKGVWMIDCLGECISGPKGDTWIEITDSQLKFEPDGKDNLYPDPERLTFEVNSWSKPLTEAALNFQLMTILTACKVPSQVFCDLLEADLTAKVANLEAAMESGLAIRKWNQENNPVSSERAAHGVEMQGGIPSTLAEKINWFVEHGFEPHSCCRLKDLLYKAIAGYCIRLENRMNIGIVKSTYAFMIADPLAVLEEGEIHISFSTPFEHKMMLHDIDLLVARLPAPLPSDIQKVRAVFKIELESYRDVIVFSSKGSCSLAEKLSGGDYDGDKAWICWEPRVVDPFENAPVAKPASLDTYGIEKEKTTVADLLAYDDYMDRFLRLGFDFNLQDSLLGICTSYFESLCYQRNNIYSPLATRIAQLLGLLVDRAKAGIIFDDERWVKYLKQEGLPRILPKPAYKDRANGAPKRSNLIDRLVFETAKGVREKALANFSRRFKNVGSYDTDITNLHKYECEEMKQDDGIKKALADLRKDLVTIKDFWSTHCMGSDDSGGGEETISFGTRAKRKSVLPFQAIAERVRDDFLALRPSAEARALSPIVARWDRERSPSNHWTLLKASTMFFYHYEKPFIWYAAGVELGILKSQARGTGSLRSVVNDIWECYKIDGKAVDRKRRKAEEDQGINIGGASFDDGDADEYGDWGWMEGVGLHD